MSLSQTPTNNFVPFSQQSNHRTAKIKDITRLLKNLAGITPETMYQESAPEDLQPSYTWMLHTSLQSQPMYTSRLIGS